MRKNPRGDEGKIRPTCAWPITERSAMEPKASNPTADTELPKRTKFLTEIQEPKQTWSSTDKVNVETLPRIEMALPKHTKSTADKFAPNLVEALNDNEDPRLARFRMEH